VSHIPDGACVFSPNAPDSPPDSPPAAQLEALQRRSEALATPLTVIPPLPPPVAPLDPLPSVAALAAPLPQTPHVLASAAVRAASGVLAAVVGRGIHRVPDAAFQGDVRQGIPVMAQLSRAVREEVMQPPAPTSHRDDTPPQMLQATVSFPTDRRLRHAEPSEAGNSPAPALLVNSTPQVAPRSGLLSRVFLQIRRNAIYLFACLCALAFGVLRRSDFLRNTFLRCRRCGRCWKALTGSSSLRPHD
jgi:hypothetical protein